MFLFFFVFLTSRWIFIHHDRPEPRLLSLLYILPGYICALPAESLVDPTIYEQYIQPLIIILGKLLYLSTGYCVKPQWNEIFTNIHIDFNINPSNNLPNSCPTLAEASASFLGMLLHRLTSYSIDLRCFNLLGNIVGKYNEDDNNHQTVTNAYAESSWWTPFVNLKSIVNFCHKRINRNYKHQHSFWFIPTLMTKSLAQQLIKAFLYPIMQQLENTHDHLKCLLQNKNNTQMVIII
ncbi:unnamed protein product [Heterobilharzia americana]|nr:unnamed protein product [Heterobilharzia americana]